MELIVDFSSDLQNEKYNMFIDTLYENNHLENYIKKVLELEKIESDRPLYLSLLLTDNKNIQVINREYRDKDAPTDVISFAYHETEDFNIGPYDTLGDIIISLERVEEQASEYNHLSDANITFKEIEIIVNSFLKTFGAIYHERIKYPGQK